MLTADDRLGTPALSEAMIGAARELPGDPGAHIFLEDRVEWSVAAAPGRRAETTSIRTVGVAVTGRRALHLADPGVETLAAIAAATGSQAGLPALARATPLSEVLPGPAVPFDAWCNAASELAAAGLSARIVGFRQMIWVAGAGGEIGKDVRQTARIEVGLQTGSPARLRKVVREQIPSADDLKVELDAIELRNKTAAPIDGARDRGPVVFAPGAAGMIVHELVGHALEGDLDPQKVALTRSGGRVGPGGLRVIDDPRRGRAAWTIDDEGVESSAVTLVDEGRVVGRIHDRASARLDGGSSSGHGRRGSFLDPILPRMGCTYIDAGEDDPAAILEATHRGIYVRALDGGHADPCTGRATFLVTSADAIEQGRTTQPLRPFLLVLDAIEALASIDQIGNDLVFDSCIGSCVRNGQPLVVSVGAPTVRLGLISAVI